VQRRTVILGGGCGCILLLTCAGPLTFLYVRQTLKDMQAMPRKAFRTTVFNATLSEVVDKYGAPDLFTEDRLDYSVTYYRRTINPKSGKVDSAVSMSIDKKTGRVWLVLYDNGRGDLEKQD
jgi:hypothetical protein